jgi:CarD family transcriptional regulator
MQPIDTIAVRAVNAQVTMCGWSRIVLAVHHRRRRYQRKERLALSPSSARSPRLALWAGVARCGAQFPTLAAVFEMLVTQRTSPAYSDRVCQVQHHLDTALWLAQTPPTRERRRAKLGCAKGVQNNMTFTVGETVVYPTHGAAVIEDIETRQIKGEDRLYLVLRIVGQSDLVVRVPACNLDLVGVRDVVDADGLERVFGVLRAPHTEEPTNWSRRYKANLEKLHSGNVLKVAEVVRDLWRRERERGLSAGEKRMLAKARQILVSELALAERVEEDKAEVLLDEVLAS